MVEFSVTQTLRSLFAPIITADHRHRRLLGILQGVVTSLGNRVVGVVVSLLSVPLTIGYLGAEQYGVWITLGSFLAWLSLTDFGLGNGLTNAVTTAAGQDRPDLVRMHLSNAVLLLGGIACILAVVGALVWPFVQWSAVFGVRSDAARAELGPALATAFAIFLLQFPLAITGKVFLAYQDGRLGNYWGLGGNLASLGALLVVTRTHGGLTWLVLALSGTGLIVNYACTAWVFIYHRPTLRPGRKHVDLSYIRSLTTTGIKFFLLQIMALVTFSSDNFVIAHYQGAARVPEYSLTYNLFNYTTLPQTILFSYLWSAYAEAIARKDLGWVTRVFRLNNWFALGFTAAACVALTLITKPFIAWWAGTAVVPSTNLVLWMAAWSIVNALTNPISCFLAAANHLENQLIYSAVATISNIALSIYLVQQWGVYGVIAATVISYAVFVCIPIQIDARYCIRKLQRAV